MYHILAQCANLYYKTGSALFLTIRQCFRYNSGKRSGKTGYQKHPEHVKAADTYVRPYTEIRMCMDFELD